jgi:hypothetical protein
MPSLRRERPKGSARQALDTLIDCESETLEALQAAIEPTGREAVSV